MRVGFAEGLGGERGIYLLVLEIPSMRIRVGALGLIRFVAGIYGYVGSASGKSVTLRHRLLRHFRKAKRLRWHIDYVTSHARVDPLVAYVSLGRTVSEKRLAELCAGAFPAIPRFGNSDMSSSAQGHLFLLRAGRGERPG